MSTAAAKTVSKNSIVQQLVNSYGIDPAEVLFLDEKNPDEPWLSAGILTTIARQEDVFTSIDEGFTQYIQPLSQLVHSATVVDKLGRSFSRSGVATIGERGDFDSHALAASRALRAAMTAAGFDPLKGGSVLDFQLKNRVQISPKTPTANDSADEAALRNRHLGGIHALAERAGLITAIMGGRKDMTAYREWLMENYGVDTAALLNETERTSAMNALSLMCNDSRMIS